MTNVIANLIEANEKKDEKFIANLENILSSNLKDYCTNPLFYSFPIKQIETIIEKSKINDIYTICNILSKASEYKIEEADNDIEGCHRQECALRELQHLVQCHQVRCSTRKGTYQTARYGRSLIAEVRSKYIEARNDGNNHRHDTYDCSEERTLDRKLFEVATEQHHRYCQRHGKFAQGVLYRLKPFG